MRSREAVALSAVLFILAVTAAWWALALWPLPPVPPEWIGRTRLVCFGATPDGLPTTAGWMLLLLEPPSMLAVLLVIWGGEVGDGLRALARHAAGRAVLLGASALVALCVAAAASRIHEVKRSTSSTARAAVASWAAVNRPAPELDLVDQHGDRITLRDLAGRPALVTFAYGHCQTICPLLVDDLIRARRQAGTGAPALYVVTLDPWRDTPARLAPLAIQWKADPSMHVLGGTPKEVSTVLDAWGVPSDRDPTTGEISHPNVIYVVGSDGRIGYQVRGGDAGMAVGLALKSERAEGIRASR